MINIADHRKTEPRVVHRDKPLTVFGREYVVRRTSSSGNPAGGWFSVKDSQGEMLFVRAGDLPDAVIVDLIGAWTDGFGVGRKQAAKAAARGTGDIV
ncbi:hypothetical protein SAMN05216338_1001875 [Bradyrhizobium sp. Rc2d]|uniref:hypothetical protein n=1 Tax=Bradyrhizobium sp. Rc2d TaxID=1855321 RepID=UPI000883FA81|nr:hypothetical protein [Bradyrhizobium sp. Rc2d]SDG60312.1 hypothetical protein SAMN05216338_1001875 [Bradyrhizobium sp. Rc2d]